MADGAGLAGECVERIDRRKQLLVAATLAGVALSAWLLAVVCFLSAPEFVALNRARNGARYVAATGAVLVPITILLAVLWAFKKQYVCSSRLARIAGAVSPGLLLWAVPMAFSRRTWQGADIPLLIFIGGFSLSLERLLRVALPNWVAVREWLRRHTQLSARTRSLLARTIVLAAISYYAVTISRLTILGHHRMETLSSDLAEFDNLFFNALHGHPFRSPAIDGDLRNWGALKVHAEFILYLLLPVYAARPGPETLLVLQTLAVAATAVPVFLLGHAVLANPLAL